MSRNDFGLSRRTFLEGTASAILATGFSPAFAAAEPVMKKKIAKSGELVPVIGMGSWITFNVGQDPELLASRQAVLQAFFDHGGAVVDSSPMYGTSEEVIGHCLKSISNKDALFAATKVWTMSKWLGVRQMTNSETLWGTKRFDLMQIHNLLDWETHLATLLEWKAQGRVRYIGITTSHGRRHEDTEAIMRKEPIDTVQFSYSIVDREVEKRLLPAAADLGLGVLINRPFETGMLFDRYGKKPLPEWSKEIGCTNWAQFFLKFIVSHPSVTCAIPATSKVDHMVENMGANSGPMPDEAMRKRMVAYVESL
jgi:aryl-alcohol dehydrogenase-like predicted oxidoreductase